MTTKSTDSASIANEYFDLHTSGVGYLNRTREVKTPGGNFLACDIAALRGSKDNVQYTRFDCIVRGKKASSVIETLMPEVAADKAVLIGFTIGDTYAETFTYSSGDNAGETGVSLKSRLLKITWAKVDGKTVYSARSESQTSNDENASSEDSNAAQPQDASSAS